ncbi:hypothetical protein ALO82_102648 [Pseudomonas syringae pv. broussonetiae]|uniref:Uncharacterized protein n=3 Tax=Pseudomonas syringae group genomosp. 2 TaxID=251698 RepID=A0A3M4KXF8_PSEA0|nr:hypothetical protein PSYMO_20863 [Pseudomonas amygdali pv. mori str. 301020]KPW52683.1 hypothetical protein ALO82_102648 [Pseudomonas syringae pv. broussonetiae]RMQ33888.1 hypothetical protein ALQ05_102130 [Pseudomonas amygdali pv. mori]RMS27987.1 hypothetical protein ALP70_102855 [Pseudomonas savastanoi]RMS38995.1 hypothetical protein ALP67_102468 [Pseudomonas ficuserectae]
MDDTYLLQKCFYYVGSVVMTHAVAPVFQVLALEVLAQTDKL